jgi:isoquinoline 1-oxidoreductase beta subunit
MNRRKFLIRAGIGVGVTVGLALFAKAPLRRALAQFADESQLEYTGSGGVDVWFELTTDGNIILYSPKVEMGQGILQALSQIAAEELEIDWRNIIVKHATSQHGPVDNFSTGGSLSVSGLYNPLRELAATFREMIKENAASLMKVESSTLVIENGLIKSGHQTITLAQVAAQSKEWKEPKKEPILKSPNQFKIIGQEMVRFDLLPKIKGECVFGIDSTLPDMLFGSIARPPVLGAIFKSATEGQAASMQGVIKVVIEENFAGVVATSRFEAEQAKRALDIVWDMPDELIQQEKLETLTKVGAGTSVNIQKEGNASKILSVKDIIEGEYFSPFGVHAHMEPNGALADVNDTSATIKISTQVVSLTRDEVAKALDIDKENVNIEPAYLGGGFGRRLHTPHAVEAALMSKAVKKPVHVFWERTEEFQNGFLRPATHNVLKAKLDSNGMIEAIEHNTSSGDVAFSSPLLPKVLHGIVGADFGAWRGSIIHYSIPHIDTISWRCKLPIETSWWRGLGLLPNTFALESFMDDLAHRADIDPLEFRLKHLPDTELGIRIKNVLKSATQKAGWGKEVIDGHALGLAFSVDVNTPVAMVAEVRIVEGEIKVVKVTCSIDPGLIVNPDGVKSQCEGAIIMSLSASLFEEVTVKDGVVTPNRFGYYTIAQLRDAPDIDVVLHSTGDEPHGVGEPPMGPIAAAIGNAVFILTGKRLNRLPLKLV